VSAFAACGRQETYKTLTYLSVPVQSQVYSPRSIIIRNQYKNKNQYFTVKQQPTNLEIYYIQTKISKELMLVARVDEGNKGVGLQVWKYIRKHRDSN